MRPPDMLAILFLVVIAIPVARADCDTFVSPSGNDTGSCAAVTSPCLTIRYAATAGLSALREGSCNASVTVFLLPGVYTGPDNKNLELDGRSLNFSLFSLQAFTSNNAKLRDHPHPQVLIDLELNGTFLHVMFNENVQQKLTLMGLAIHGASNVGQLNCGGALFADGPGEVDVTNCTFVGNQIYAASQGSAICAHQAHVFVDESRFNNNTGGAVVVLNGALDVHHSTFISNTIESSDGAAIFAYYADVTLHKATFTNNFGLQPTVFGGATVIAQYGHLLNISHCTFTINSGGLRGGAVEIGPTAQVWITDSQFVGNNAHTGGAILIGWEYESVMQVSAVNITNCKFTGNHADLGGAIALLGATNTTAYVVDSTFSLNRGDESGGAVYESLGSSVFATPVYDNCIFENNVAAGRGGAMHLHGSGSIVTNCTFTGNSAYDGGGIFAERCAGGNVTCACLDTDDCSLALLDSTVETNHAIDNGGGIFCTCKLFFGTNVLRGNEAQGELTDMACKDCTWENQNEDNLCLPNPEPAPLSPPRGLHLPWWLWVTVGMIVALVLITGSVAVAMCSGSNTEEQHPLIDAPRKRKRTVTINN